MELEIIDREIEKKIETLIWNMGRGIQTWLYYCTIYYLVSISIVDLLGKFLINMTSSVIMMDYPLYVAETPLDWTQGLLSSGLVQLGSKKKN